MIPYNKLNVLIYAFKTVIAYIETKTVEEKKRLYILIP